jgi:hypothetical protein
MNDRSFFYYVLLISLSTVLIVFASWLIPSQPDYPYPDINSEKPSDLETNIRADNEQFFDHNPVFEVYYNDGDPISRAKADLPPHLSGIEKGTWPARISFLHQLPSDLEVSECEQIMTWLKLPLSPDEMSADGHVIRNEAMTTLRRQQKIDQRLTETLIFIAQDANQDDTTRGYAVQHLSSWYEEWDNPYHRELIRNCLWTLVTDRMHEYGGTSLLALWRLSYLDHEINRSSLAEIARAYVEVNDTLQQNVVVGLQVCAEMNIESVLPAATRHMNFSKYYTTRLVASRTVEKFD